MVTQSYDLLVIGGGIHGAAVARDAAGRGLKVMLAEKGDYACATSSASSKLIHGGLRYLEQLELSLVRESLVERAGLLKTAPHLVEPIRFLLPIYGWQKRPAILLHAGLSLYDLLSIGDGLPPSGRLKPQEIAELPRLRRENLNAVLHYHDCQTDDARLVLAVLLDARARGADILNRRAVTAIEPLANGYAVEMDERGLKHRVDARFIVNAAGPSVAEIDAMSRIAPPPRRLRLVRGSHIVLNMPEPIQDDAYTLQDTEDRVIFVLPWLDRRFLIVGTTEVPQESDAGTAACSLQEQAYLLDAYNRYFARPGGPVSDKDVVWSFAGVRALQDDHGKKPSRLTRRPALASIGTAPAASSPSMAESSPPTAPSPRPCSMRCATSEQRWAVLGPRTFRSMAAARRAPAFSPSSRKDPRASRVKPAIAGPSPMATRSKGFMRMSCVEPSLAREIAPGVPLAELVACR